MGFANGFKAGRVAPTAGARQLLSVVSSVVSFVVPCMLLGMLPAALAQPDPAAIRQAEMASCAPGEAATWPDGRDRPAAVGAVRLVYQHQGAPARFSEGTVRAALQRAATAWSACGVPGTVAEHTDKGPATTAGDVQVRWDDAATRGHFALADVGRRQLWLSAAMFSLLAQRNPRHPAQETLQMAISHEVGHFFGLMAHSRRCVDVMSYYSFGPAGAEQRCSLREGGDLRATTEYRALLPTACDIARCRAVNAGR